MPNFALNQPDGRLVLLSALGGPFALLALSAELDTPQTHLLRSFAEKSREVRPEITRAVVVTCPEHLSTVVALVDNTLILSDNTREAVLQLAPEDSMIYIVDDHRQVTNISSLEQVFASPIPRSLRPTA